MTGRPRIIAVVAAAGAIGLAGYCLLRKEAGLSAPSKPRLERVEQPAPMVAAPVIHEPSRIAIHPPDAKDLAAVPPNPMAAAIGSGELGAAQEIALVLDLFQLYRREFGAFPAGQTNAHFMNALRGGNPGRLPIFPPAHPRLDPAGNLLDRWQRPYQFHPVSRERLEIRSAGPDMELFTADDLVVPPKEGR